MVLKSIINQTSVEDTPELKIVGWTCDVDQFNDGLCIVTGKMGPRLRSSWNISLDVRGCPKLAAVTRNMTDAVSIRKFCVEQQDDINCDLPTPEDYCPEYNVGYGEPPSLELQEIAKNALRRIYCKRVKLIRHFKTLNFEYDGTCTLSPLYTASEFTCTTGYNGSLCLNGGTAIGDEGRCPNAVAM